MDSCSRIDPDSGNLKVLTPVDIAHSHSYAHIPDYTLDFLLQVEKQLDCLPHLELVQVFCKFDQGFLFSIDGKSPLIIQVGVF